MVLCEHSMVTKDYPYFVQNLVKYVSLKTLIQSGIECHPFHWCSKHLQIIPPSIHLLNYDNYSGGGILCLLLILKHQHIATTFH